MTTELIEFADTKRVLSEALDEALAVFSKKADVRPMVSLVVLLDGIIARCVELQPEATERLLAVYHRVAKDMLMGLPDPLSGLELCSEQASAMHLLSVAIDGRIEANA